MKTADVVVIGGGMAGIGAAAKLSVDLHVVVLEAENALGYHATGRSAAVYIRNYGNATLRALNAASEPFLVSPHGISDQSLLSPRGQLLLASDTAHEQDALQSYADGAEGLERLTAADALALVPILRKDRIAAALYEPGAQGIDVDRMLQGFARQVTANKSEISKASTVKTIERRQGLWTVATATETWQAPIVVNAAGGWADRVATLAGVAPLGLRACRRSAAMLPAPEEHDVTHWPVFASAAETWYAKPEAGRLMVSPADEDPVPPHDVFADDMVLAEGLDRYEQAVTVPVTRVLHSWAGLRTFAPDRTPVVGYDVDESGFFWLAGQGGYGIQTAPALSELTAALITQRPPPLAEAVVAALSPARFAA